MGALTEITDSNFQANVIEADKLTIVDFWAPWCGPCRAVAPILEEIAGERSDVQIVKLNIDDNQETAAKYSVMSIPTMIVFKAGAPVKQIVGVQPKSKLLAEIDSVA